MGCIGKLCCITDKESVYFGMWGIIRGYDGYSYLVELENDRGVIPLFDRKQIRIPRK